MKQYVVPLIVFTYGLIAALFGYVIKMERRVGRTENWIEFVGKTAQGLTKVLERPTHMERDSLLRRYRGEEKPPLSAKDRTRLAEILEGIVNESESESSSGEKLIAAINLATIRFKS